MREIMSEQIPEQKSKVTRGGFLRAAGAALAALGLIGAGNQAQPDQSPQFAINKGEKLGRLPELKLSEEQLARLRYTSFLYTAGKNQAFTIEEKMEKVNFIQPEDLKRPDVISGPIAVSILKDAGLYTPPQDFNINDLKELNPDVDREKVRKLFSPEKYYEYDTSTPVDRFDFRSNPLMPGDLVFLRPGNAPDGLNQYIAITGIGNNEGPLTVTSYMSKHWGFTIGEVTLYEPGRADTGMLREWTGNNVSVPQSYENGDVVGRTGQAGFHVWRLKSP